MEVSGASEPNWCELSEERLFYEVAVCVFSSQMLFETAVATADRIHEEGLFDWDSISNTSTYERKLLAVLCEPVSVYISGKTRKVRPRFKNRWASLLANTSEKIYLRNTSLRDMLLTSHSSHLAREKLVECVWGFGPKQASLFLRRIGYCSDLAILDTHILDYLRLARGINPKPSALSRLPSYERIEIEFKDIASEFGYPVGCVDLAIWITMRVAKREKFYELSKSSIRGS